MKNKFDSVQLTLPAKAEYVSTARLVASSMANRLGFNIDEIEDIKVAVSEVCSNFVKKTSDSSDYTIEFSIIDQSLEISFICSSFTGKLFDNEDEVFASAIITALMDWVKFHPNTETIVSMSKSIGENT